MITGIGTDIVEISRMSKTIENSGFLRRYFTEAENDFFLQKNFNPASVAASFAAKEALSKALGTGFMGFSLKDIEVLRDKLGKPYINVYNNVKQLTQGASIHLSLSHSDSYAIAFVVLEII